MMLRSVTRRRLTGPAAQRVLRKPSSTAAAEPSIPVPDVKGPDWLGMTVFGSICAAAFGLGTWQIQRYGWKVDLMEKMKGNTKAEPTAIPLEYPADLSPLIPSDFPSDLNQYYLQQFVSEADGRRMTVTGTYDYDNEFLLGPRSAPGILGEQAAQGMSQNPQGYWVITPLHREDGTITLVKRGWVMCDKGTVKLEKQAYEKPKGKVTVTVIADNYEPRTRFAPENSPYTKKLWWYELESVHKILGKFVSNTHGSAFLRFPVMLEAVMEDEEEITTYPVSRRVKAIGEQHVTPATHMVYAVTWFSLGLAGTFMTVKKFGGSRMNTLMGGDKMFQRDAYAKRAARRAKALGMEKLPPGTRL